MKRLFYYLYLKVLNFVRQPYKVFMACVLFVLFHFFIQGSLYKWLKLNLDERNLNAKMTQLQLDAKEIERKNKNLEDPQFLKKLIRERLDLVSKGDLIFLFSESE